VGKRILCVDDDPQIRDLLQKSLAGAGHQVATAADGVEGLKAALAGRFDLIICDVMMPYVDGYELCRELKDHPETKDTPLIIVTARQGHLSERTAQIAGAVAFLQKPFRLQELGAIVAKVLLGKGQKR
jgi:two-component system phosphate regulon response regulator PhoB/two-component system alkaline phosphatase synthesis response regulator PhoP